MLPADSPFAPLPAPGAHPATADLRAYAAGTLAPAEQHRIEAHALDCERCAELLEGFSMTDTATTDHAVDALRSRLRSRIGTAEPEPVVGGWAWPRVAAAAALLAVAAGGIWTWEQHSPTEISPAVARTETVTPAARPRTPVVSPAATASEPAPAVSSPEEIATTVAPANPKPVDYAAAAPARFRKQKPLRRLRAGRPAAAARPVVAADAKESTSIASVAKPVPEQEAQADGLFAKKEARSTVAMAAPAEAKKDSALKENAAVDTAASPAALPGRVAAAKAKAEGEPAKAPAVGNAARVANTPMPATFSINPAPVGGKSALRDYIRREAMSFELEPGTKPLSGTVRVKFIVGADGKVSNLRVSHGLRADYDAEAVRIVCDGPTWQPGISGGRRAPMPMEVTISF